MTENDLKEAMKSEQRIITIFDEIQTVYVDILEMSKDDCINPSEIVAALLLFAYTLNLEFGEKPFDYVAQGFCPIAQKLYNKHIKNGEENGLN